jgi:hypothetical protein
MDVTRGHRGGELARPRGKRFVLAGLLAVIAAAGIALGGARWSIANGVRQCRQLARSAYPRAADDTAALIAFVRSEQHSLAARNRAVWALGRSGDRRALDPLRSFYTGAECDHERFLCQRELAKAIRRCDGTP